MTGSAPRLRSGMPDRRAAPASPRRALAAPAEARHAVGARRSWRVKADRFDAAQPDIADISSLTERRFHLFEGNGGSLLHPSRHLQHLRDPEHTVVTQECDINFRTAEIHPSKKVHVRHFGFLD